MHRPHCSNAATHTPCVCDTPILRSDAVAGFHPSVCTQAGISQYIFCVVAQSTDHLPDNNIDRAQSLLTSSLLHYHNPATRQQQLLQQQQWAHLARIDDRTAQIAVCRPTLPLLQPCSAQWGGSSSRQGISRMYVCGRSALYSQYY